MATRTKRWPWVLVFLGAILAGFYVFAFGFGVQAAGNWSIDLPAVRALAQTVPGAKASAINVETVATMKFPNAFFEPRRGFAMVPMAIESYQLVFPDKTAIIDTALTSIDGMPGGQLDSQALGRMSQALAKASLIVVTHEHMDHLGGLASQPNVKDLLKVAKLNLEQVSHPELLSPAKFPPGALDGYQPFAYEKIAAVAPGVVLIRAPGHTPGSQIVYVQRADGEEYLFLGDVAWLTDNVDDQIERPMIIKYMTHEDRSQVQRQLEVLNQLRTANPKLHFVYGHDPKNFRALVEAGLLHRGFN